MDKIPLTAQEETQRIKESMDNAVANMTEQEVRNFLRIVSANSGVEFLPKDPVVIMCNLDYLHLLYSRCDFIAIAKDRVTRMDSEGGPYYEGDFGFQDIYDENGILGDAYERAIAREIKWLMEIRR